MDVHIYTHAGKDKWYHLQKNKLRFLINTKWNGRTYSLEKFIDTHQGLFVILQEASDRFNFNITTKHSRVIFLVANILNNYPELCYAISSVWLNISGMKKTSIQLSPS